jgi:thiol-disulfide isomerase/thioredoxin
MKPWFTLSAALIAAGLGYWAWQARQPAPVKTDLPPPPTISADQANEQQLTRLPALSYPDLNGKPRAISEWQDKVLVLNFWATWCPPCREETPLFVALQDEYRERGVQFVGLAIDDLEAVQTFVDTYGVEYPVLIGDIDAVDVSRRLGNRFSGLPYTVIVAPGGEIVIRHAGGLTREQIVPVLERLAQPSSGG